MSKMECKFIVVWWRLSLREKTVVLQNMFSPLCCSAYFAKRSEKLNSALKNATNVHVKILYIHMSLGKLITA